VYLVQKVPLVFLVSLASLVSTDFLAIPVSSASPETRVTMVLPETLVLLDTLAREASRVTLVMLEIQVQTV